MGINLLLLRQSITAEIYQKQGAEQGERGTKQPMLRAGSERRCALTQLCYNTTLSGKSLGHGLEQSFMKSGTAVVTESFPLQYNIFLCVEYSNFH